MKKQRSKKPSSDESEHRLVYSTDPPQAERCKGCRRVVTECVCGPPPFVLQGMPRIRLERKGRGGKSVTVIDRLPSSRHHLEALCGLLKRMIGCGGTWYLSDTGEGVVEVQGDRRSEVPSIIAKYKDSLK